MRKRVMTGLVDEEHRVLTVCLSIVAEVQRLFDLHKCEWMFKDLENYSEKIVWEFHDSYIATL